MTQVFFTTLQKVGMLLLFIGIGYLLRRTKQLPENTGTVLSRLSTLVFCPAYTIKNLAENVTLDTIGQKVPLLLHGTVLILLSIGLAIVLAKVFGRTDMERRSLKYAFSIPNYGFFGYPIVEGVFGTAVLADVMLFALPMSIATYTFGYLLFIRNEKMSLKRLLASPTIISVAIGLALGLSGLKLPAVVDDVLAGAGGCMSTVAMLLAGFVLGGFPLRKLMTGGWSYLISLMRLIVIPAVFCAVLYLVGFRDIYLLAPLSLMTMPLGLNIVVFPESLGEDASENARLCFVSYILAIAIVPVTFAIVAKLSGLS